jgi:cytochrome P450
MPATRARLPGPKLPLGLNPIRFLRAPNATLLALAREHGQVAAFRLLHYQFVLVSDPELVRDILVTHDSSFMKGQGIQELKKLLGEGLLTSEGDIHHRQRRLIQPIFNHQRIASYATDMVAIAARATERWRDGETLDVAAEMMRVTLAIVGKTIFDADVEGSAPEIGLALKDMLGMSGRFLLPFSKLLERLPLPSNRRFARSKELLDSIIRRLIAERRSHPGKGDLLALLLEAMDVEGDGKGMSEERVRDEAMTLFLAGHETTAQTLSWTLYLMSEHPEAQRKLEAELAAVLGDRLPIAEDYPRLVYTKQLLSESMRLYPPAWVIGRRALDDYPLRDSVVPKGTIVITSPYVSQRDPRYFPDPERFDPERFTPEAVAARPRYAYYPFGGGSRVCIGEGFAWLEGMLLLATFCQRWRMKLVPGHPVVEQPLVTLRPKHGIRMTLSRRPSA